MKIKVSELIEVEKTSMNKVKDMNKIELGFLESKKILDSKIYLEVVRAICKASHYIKSLKGEALEKFITKASLNRKQIENSLLILGNAVEENLIEKSKLIQKEEINESISNIGKLFKKQVDINNVELIHNRNIKASSDFDKQSKVIKSMIEKNEVIAQILVNNKKYVEIIEIVEKDMDISLSTKIKFTVNYEVLYNFVKLLSEKGK